MRESVTILRLMVFGSVLIESITNDLKNRTTVSKPKLISNQKEGETEHRHNKTLDAM